MDEQEIRARALDAAVRAFLPRSDADVDVLVGVAMEFEVFILGDTDTDGEAPACGWNPTVPGPNCDWDRACPEHGEGARRMGVPESASTGTGDEEHACVSCGHGKHDRGPCGGQVYTWGGRFAPCTCRMSRTVQGPQ